MIDFALTADAVAPQLLGCTLTHAGVSIRLTEVEAYLGAEDSAAHTFNGKTPRNAAMFGPPGRFYVYISYGIHRNVNIVCAPEALARAVCCVAVKSSRAPTPPSPAVAPLIFITSPADRETSARPSASRSKTTTNQYRLSSEPPNQNGCADRVSVSPKTRKRPYGFGSPSIKPSRAAAAIPRNSPARFAT